MSFIREIDSNSSEEIDLVASRMKMTLMDVLGEEKGQSMYSMEWLRERVLWHLSKDRVAKIFLSENDQGTRTGQAIVRIERDDNNTDYGFFSTIYVATEFRRKGIASDLIKEVIQWCESQDLPRVVYNTASDNQKLLKLFENYGFEMTLRGSEMVQISKNL